MAKKNKKKAQKKLTNKYRLVIINDDTYEEKLSFKLTRLNVYVFGGLFSMMLILMTILLIAFTPLREYIPGYSSAQLRKKTHLLIDSLQSITERQQALETKMYVLQQILSGKVPAEKFHNAMDSALRHMPPVSADSMYASHQDSLFRKEVERMKSFSINDISDKEVSEMFLSPVKGVVTAHFDPTKKHYAVDIAVTKDTPVKAIFDGQVLFSEWSAATGYVLMVDHGNFISVYKHNSSVMKEQGEKVKAGEVIALAGSEGEESSGPHLHFELWINGVPVDPEQYLEFD